MKIHISTTNFDHLDFRKHPNEEAPLLAVRFAGAPCDCASHPGDWLSQPGEKSSPKIDLKKSVQKNTKTNGHKLNFELVKQAENTIRSVQYKLDDPCEPPNPLKL